MKDIQLDLTPPLSPDYTWDAINTAFASLQTNIAGYLPKDVSAGGTVPLPAEESYNGLLVFTGALPNNTTVEVPAAAMRWGSVIDATSGNYTLTFKAAGGSGFVLPKNQPVSAFCDGTDVKQVGLIKAVWSSSTAVNYYVSDGTDDVLIGTLNPTTNAWTHVGAMSRVESAAMAMSGVSQSTGSAFTAPANVNQIVLGVNGVSFSDTGQLDIQIGDAGGIETSGYFEIRGSVQTGSTSFATNSNLHRTTQGLVAASAVYGHITLTLIDTETNLWLIESNLTDATAVQFIGVCVKALSQPLTTVLVKGSSAGTFDAGTIYPVSFTQA